MWCLWWLACTASDDAPIEPFDRTETMLTEWESPLVFEGPRPRNLLMISIDTLRRDHLGFYGGEADTDFLDGLLAESVHLDDHMQCSSWTYASTSCTLMGALHEDNGYMPRLTKAQNPIPRSTTFFAELMSDAGYFTMIHSNNDWLSALWGNTQGYQVQANLGGDARKAALDARGLLEAAVTEDQPWFLHLHFTEPHAPYNPPASYLEGIEDLPSVPYDLADRDVHYDVNGDDLYEGLSAEEKDAVEQQLRFRYRGEIAWLDDKLEDIFADYGAAGLLEDTLVVLWTDHGEAFFEHVHQTHAWDLYPQENNAILAFWSPDLAPVSWTGPTTSIDMVPTLLDVYGLPIPEAVRGLPLGSARDDRVRYASIDARAGVEQLVRQGPDALLYQWRTGRVHRFDLAADPDAQNDLYQIGDQRSIELWQQLLPYRDALDPLTQDSFARPVGLP